MSEEVMTNDPDAAMMLLTRRATGLSQRAFGRRIGYSKQQVHAVETGKRRVTPDYKAAVAATFPGIDTDMNLRQIRTGLSTLAAGVLAPRATTDDLNRAFAAALDEARMSTADWAARAAEYGLRYMIDGAGELQARLAADLVRLQPLLGDPELAAIAARLCTVNGKTMPAVGTDRSGALLWYGYGTTAADRSGDLDTRVWTRGRAALALAYEGAEIPAARRLAIEAVEIAGDRPSLGRLNAELALAHARGIDGDRDGARSAIDRARRTFDTVGSPDGEISDFAIPEWRFNVVSSMLYSRLGMEDEALDAQATVDRTRPAALVRFGTHVELHRGLMLVKAGDRAEGVRYARDAIARLPQGSRSLSLDLMLHEIEQAAAA